METTNEMQADFKRKMIPVSDGNLHKRILYLAGVMGAKTGKATTMEEVVEAGVELLETKLNASMDTINAN